MPAPSDKKVEQLEVLATSGSAKVIEETKAKEEDLIFGFELYIFIGIVCGGIVVLMIIIFLLCKCCNRNKGRDVKHGANSAPPISKTAIVEMAGEPSVDIEESADSRVGEADKSDDEWLANQAKG